MCGIAVTVRPPAYLRGMSNHSPDRESGPPPISLQPEMVDDHSLGDLTIDCGSCLARPVACGDCIVTVLLGPIGMVGQEERVAFAVLADSGLVPPLRLVTGDQGVA